MYYPFVNQWRQGSSNVMTVTGTGNISVQPNIVSIQFEVRTENMSLAQAQQENAKAMQQVMQSLLALGIPKENIQTTAFTISPMYDFVDGKQVFRGYQVVNTITVKLTNFDQVGHVIDVAVKNGVNQVSNIQFTVSDQAFYYRQALSAALEDARLKAKTIADTMQLHLDPTPIKIVERLTAPPTTMHAMAMAEKSFTTPIAPGQIQIQAVVEVQFQY